MSGSVQIYLRKEDADLTTSDVSRDIEVWKEKSGKRLPVEYRNFLLTYLVGFPFPGCFGVSPDPWPEFLDENPQEVPDLYTWKHVQDLISTNYYRDGCPSGYLIIGDAVSPAHLLLGIREDNFGKIFLWHHSSDDWGGNVNNEAGLVLVAENFDDLLRALYDGGSGAFRRNWGHGAKKARVAEIKL